MTANHIQLRAIVQAVADNDKSVYAAVAEIERLVDDAETAVEQNTRLANEAALKHPPMFLERE